LQALSWVKRTREMPKTTRRWYNGTIQQLTSRVPLRPHDDYRVLSHPLYCAFVGSDFRGGAIDQHWPPPPIHLSLGPLFYLQVKLVPPRGSLL